MQLGSMFISNCNNALHVSEVFCVHPQEHLETVVAALMFLLPTNALLHYTYKMLKYTVKTSHYRSYMFRSIWTIIRELMPNLARVTMDRNM